MKIVLIHEEKEPGLLSHLQSELKKKKIHHKNFPVSATGGRGFMTFPGTHDTTHALILSFLPPRWYDFLAGFSCGSDMPFYVCGEKAITAIPGEFISRFMPIKTQGELNEFLKTENKKFKEREIAMSVTKARETLMQTGIPINEESLANCAGEGNMWEVSLFLAAGFSPDTRNKAGIPLLNISARKGNREVLRFLIMAGAQLNLLSNDRGTSALLDGVMANHFDIAEELIKAGADLDVKSKGGQTALIVAVGSANENIVEALLKAGADPDISDSLGVSARKYNALFKKEAIVNLFNTYAPDKEA